MNVPRLLLVAVLAALAATPPARADAAEVRVFSRCTEKAPEGAEVTLVLEGLDWSDWPDQCARLARYLRPGPPPVEATYAGTASRLLTGTGFFASAQCRTTAQTVTCILKPQQMVYDVDIEGHVPFGILKDDLRRRVYLRPGTLLTKEKESIARQRKRLEDYLRREGYFGSVVRMSTEPVHKAQPNYGLRLRADVNPGRTVLLRKVTIRGWTPPEFGPDRIEAGLRHYVFLWFGRARFRPTQFEDDLQSLTEALQRKGYPEAQLDGDWHLDLTRGEADVILRLEAGPKLTLRFVGNAHLSAKKLKEQATFTESAVIDQVEVEDTADAIGTRYQQAGYYEVKVEAEVETPGEHATTVTYRITEGPKAKVTEVRFTGNSAFSSDTLRSDVELGTTDGSFLSPGRWVDAQVAADIRSVEDFYLQHGYAAAKATASKEVLEKGKLAAVFHVDEGPRRWVETVTMEGLPEGVDREALFSRLKLTENRPYVHPELGNDRREILTTLAAAGYPNGVVHRDMTKPKPSEGGPVVIHYRIEPGPRSLFGGFLVRGNFRTVRSVLANEISLDPGAPLDLVALGRARRRLRGLGPFSSVELKPLDLWRETPSTWLLVAVQERDQRALDAVGAYSTDNGFQVGVDYRDHNLFGRAIRLDTTLRLGTFFDLIPGGSQGRGLRIGNADIANATLAAPQPLGAPFDASGSLFYRYEDRSDYTERRIGGSAGLVRDLVRRSTCALCPDSTASLKYELQAATLNDHTLRFVAFTQSYGQPKGNIGRIVPSVHLDRRDSFVDPRQGYVADLRFEVALTALTPLPGGSDFWRFITTEQGYLTLGTPFETPIGGEKLLGGPVVAAVGVTFGAERPFGSSRLVPETETFYYGGDFSVRGMVNRGSRIGFPGANYLFVGSGELRWYFLQNIVFGSFQLALFTDVGAVSYDTPSLFSSPTVSVGAALRFVTPVGPLSLAYGLGVVRPQEIVLQDPTAIPRTGRLHITFGYPF